MPGTFSYPAGPAVWDGREVLFLSFISARGLAYNPATNRWTYLPAMPLQRSWFTAVWTGQCLLVWGGFPPAPISLRRIGRPTTRQPASGPPCPAHRYMAARTRSRCGPAAR